MLTIEKVTKKFGGITALNKCSFSIPRNKITALIGPNGAGKTTLLDVISGLVRADEGTIKIDGADISHQQPYEVANLGIARTWQQVRLFKNLTILDHLIISYSHKDTNLLRNIFTADGEQIHMYEKHFEKFGIERPLTAMVSELSYGQRKLLQLAMVLLKPHKLLLLDEPVAGVNKVIQQHIESLLLELRQRGETVVIIEHDIDFVRRLADKVVVLDAGKLLLEGLPGPVLSDKKVIEAYLGE